MGTSTSSNYNVKKKKIPTMSTIDIVKKAILELKDYRTGSSLIKIKKWIADNEKKEVKPHVMSAALKKAVADGTLIKKSVVQVGAGGEESDDETTQEEECTQEGSTQEEDFHHEEKEEHRREEKDDDQEEDHHQEDRNQEKVD